MTATNHAITGAAIGLVVSQPLVALPLAFLSHFVCDALPHFGRDDSFLKTVTFRNMLIVDALLCVLLVLFLATTGSPSWLLAAVCAFVATSPDLFWIAKYQNALKGKKWQPSKVLGFAGRIQWFQKPSGAVVEIAWFIAGVFVLSQLVLA